MSEVPLPDVPKAYDWEAMRTDGYKVVDYIVDYHKSLANRAIPCQAQVQPNYLQHSLGQKHPHVPQTPHPFDEILHDVREHIEPGMTHWQHPDFLAFFPAMLSPPALLGELIANGFNQPGFNWVASPAATELETLVTNWMVEAFGLPNDFSWNGAGGCVLQPSATEAAIVMMLAAKTRALNAVPQEERNDRSGKLVAYVSDQAHFCVEKASRILGIQHFRKIRTNRDPADGNYPMTSAALQAAMEQDVQNGLVPFFVSACFGATGICATDPVEDIARVCQQHNVWLNVDAAYAGVTAVCEELRPAFAPVGACADSIFINGSKWFSMMFNCTFLFFRDKQFVVSSLNATGVYLSNPHTDNQLVVDFKDYHLGLGRPFRAMKVYTTLKAFGIQGIQATIRRHIILAKYLHRQLAKDSRLSLPIETKFALVCFAVAADVSPIAATTEGRSQLSMQLLKFMNDERKRFMVHTVVEGETILRISLAHPQLDYAAMDALVKDVQDGLTSVLSQT